MHTALQNTHYKTIWENVLMNRHSEAESLDKALEMELQYDNCLLLDPEGYNTSIASISTAVKAQKIVEGYNQRVVKKNVDYYTRRYIKTENMLITGRPITLEDILKILDNLPDNDYCYGCNISHTDYKTFWITKSYGAIPYLDEWLCSWQLTKPLHEQTPEVWEKIAGLINNK